MGGGRGRGGGGGVVGGALGVGHHLFMLLLPVQFALSRDGEQLGEEDGRKEGGGRGSNGDSHGGVVEGWGGEVVHHWPQGEYGGEAEGGQTDPSSFVEVLLDVVDGDAAEDVDEEEDVDVDVKEEEGVSGDVALQLSRNHYCLDWPMNQEPLCDDHHLVENMEIRRMRMRRVTWTRTMKARETDWLTREIFPPNPTLSI